MEWLQSLLDNSTMPALTAFLLGLLTALSPCPLATFKFRLNSDDSLSPTKSACGHQCHPHFPCEDNQ